MHYDVAITCPRLQYKERTVLAYNDTELPAI